MIPFIFLFPIFVILPSFVFMSRNGTDTDVNQAVPSSRFGEPSQAVDANAASNNRATYIEIDCGVSSWLVAKYNTLYVNTFDTRRFRAMFSDGDDLFMFDRRNDGWDTDIGT